MRSLEGQNALVVGASRGMGKQMALVLARNGADIAVAARTVEPSQSNLPGTINTTVEEIRAEGRRAEAIKADLLNGAEIDAMVARAIELFGRIDIVVHSVQHHGPGYWATFADTTIDDIETAMWVNTMSAVRICKLIVPHMAADGGGVIVLVTSTAGNGDKGFPPGKGSTGLGYPISKAALGRFIPVLAKEVKGDGIAVMGLSPGFVASEHVEAKVGPPGSGKDFYGNSIDLAVPPTTPAAALGFLVTSDDPMEYTGMDLLSKDLVAEHHLV